MHRATVGTVSTAKLSGRWIIRCGLSLGDLRGTQIPKSSRSRPLLRNAPGDRGSGLDREAFRQMDHSARVVTEKTQTPKSSRSRPLLRNAPGDRGSGLDREDFQAEGSFGAGCHRGTWRHASTEKLAVKTAPTKCTEQPWERSRPRSFQAEGSFGAGKHLGELRGTQTPKSSRSRPLLQNAPGDRGSGLDRERLRRRTAPSSSKCPPLFARRLSSRSLNDHMDHQSPLVAIHR